MNREIEQVTCALCSSNETQVLEDKTRLLRLPEPFKVVRCSRCGLVYMNPRDLRAETYERSYYEGWNYIKYEEGRSRAYYVDKYFRLENLLPYRGAVLDLGCGGGHFLNVGKQRGWRVFGMETSDWAIGYAKKRFGLDIVKACAEAPPFTTDSFDVVVFHHVLEHFADPGATLDRIRCLIKKDGILLVEVPNEFNDLLFLVSGEWGRRRYYPSPGPVFHHVYFFTCQTITRLLENHGFSVIYISTMNRKLFLTSELPLGKFAKRVFYTLGGLFGRGPFIEVIARNSSELKA